MIIKYLVLLVNFFTNPVQPYTVQQAQGVVDTVRSAYAANSYGLVDVKGDTYGWYTLNVDNSFCNEYTWGSLASSQANIPGYQYQVFAFEPYISACPDGGDVLPFGVTAALNGYLQPYPLEHELGHMAFHLQHSRAKVIDDGVYTDVEYGDSYDPMGSGTSWHMNAIQKEHAGWLVPTVVDKPGHYTIAPLEHFPFALKIASGQDFYYLEYRQDYNVVLVHQPFLIGANHNLYNGTYLWDLYPGIGFHPTLDIGLSYVDPNTKIGFRTTALDNGNASVDITFNGLFTDLDPVPLDIIPPVVKLVAVQSGKSGNYTVTASTSDNVGVTTSTLFVDGNPFVSFTTNWTGVISLKNKVTHTFTVRSSDAANNVGTLTVIK